MFHALHFRNRKGIRSISNFGMWRGIDEYREYNKKKRNSKSKEMAILVKHDKYTELIWSTMFVVLRLLFRISFISLILGCFTAFFQHWFSLARFGFVYNIFLCVFFRLWSSAQSILPWNFLTIVYSPLVWEFYTWRICPSSAQKVNFGVPWRNDWLNCNLNWIQLSSDLVSMCKQIWTLFSEIKTTEIPWWSCFNCQATWIVLLA